MDIFGIFCCVIVSFVSCSSEVITCKHDMDCKGDKVCKNGLCVGLYENLDASLITDIDVGFQDIYIVDKNESDIEIDDMIDLSDVSIIDILDDVSTVDIGCPEPCNYEGKRFCRENGYIECRKEDAKDECPTAVYSLCALGEECRNGVCGKDECKEEGDRLCIEKNIFQICEEDENGFLKVVTKKCDIGTFCQKKLCCPSDMAEADGFCVDKYEAVVSNSPDCNGVIYGQNGDDYPAEFPDNVSLSDNPPSIYLFTCSKANVFPSRYITYLQAKAVCQLSGKRLCTEQEYIIACTGNNPTYKYPYGPSYDSNICNVYGLLKGIARCGEYAKCSSDYGAYDMSGNVEEWIESDMSNDINNIAFAMGGNSGCLSNVKCSMCSAKTEKNITASKELLGFRCCK